MHYAGARYYMSALGRWTSTDPLLNGSPAGLAENGKLRYLSATPYNYVFNNPTGLVDPTGRAASCPECDDPLIGVRAIATAVYDVKHSAQNLILNSPVGRYFKPTEAGMKRQSGYATDAQGDQIFETEIKQVPEGGALQETANLALDALVVAGGNPLAGGAGGLLARSGLKGEAARSASRNLRYTDNALSKAQNDLYHVYPTSFDPHIISNGTRVSANEGTGSLMRGSINGKEGV